MVKLTFFINGELRWGVELLVEGSGVSEHISRFEIDTGKYRPLRMLDHIIVDFRQNVTGAVTNVKQNPNKLTVFFTGDFTKCNCVYGMGSNRAMFTLDLSK